MQETGLSKGRVAQLLSDKEVFGERAAESIARKLGLEDRYFDQIETKLLKLDAATMLSTQGERLQVAMKETKKTDRKGLACAIGISQQALGMVLSGETKALTAENCSKAARHLGISTDWLAAGFGPMIIEARSENDLLEIFNRRRERLLELLQETTASQLYKDSGVAASSISSFLKKLPDGRYARNIGEKTARKIETGAKKPNGWLDQSVIITPRKQDDQNSTEQDTVAGVRFIAQKLENDQRLRQRLQQLIDQRFDGSQARFAKAIKKSPAQINQYLRGDRNLGIEMMIHIEQVLQIKDYFAGQQLQPSDQQITTEKALRTIGASLKKLSLKEKEFVIALFGIYATYFRETSFADLVAAIDQAR